MGVSTKQDHRKTKAWLAAYAESQCEAAFASLVRFYSGMVYASALRRTFDPHMAEDVAQDVFDRFPPLPKLRQLR